MKNIVLSLKRLDLVLQVTALILPVLLSLLNDWSAPVLYAYFSVGAIQVLSAIVHLLAGVGKHNHRRRQYEHTLIAVLGGAVLAVIALAISGSTGIDLGGLIYCYLVAMIVAGPVMAIYYFRLCVLETKELKSRGA